MLPHGLSWKVPCSSTPIWASCVDSIHGCSLLACDSGFDVLFILPLFGVPSFPEIAPEPLSPCAGIFVHPCLLGQHRSYTLGRPIPQDFVAVKCAAEASHGALSGDVLRSAGSWLCKTLGACLAKLESFVAAGQRYVRCWHFSPLEPDTRNLDKVILLPAKDEPAASPSVHRSGRNRTQPSLSDVISSAKCYQLRLHK